MRAKPKTSVSKFVNPGVYAGLGGAGVIIGLIVAFSNHRMSDLMGGLIFGIAGAALLLGAAVLEAGR